MTVNDLSGSYAFIGDPSILGVGVFFLYTVAAVLAWRRAVATPAQSKAETAIWWICMIFCIAFGLNKQLDMQRVLEDLARNTMQRLDIVFLKQYVKWVLFGLVLLVFIVASRTLARSFHQVSNAARTAIAGMGLVMVFVLLRAALFLDFIGSESASTHWQSGIELAGVLVVCAAAYWKGKPV